MTNPTSNSYPAVIALDVGEARTGLAIATKPASIATPLTYLAMDDDIITNLKDILQKHNVTTIVVGLPRSLDGNDTNQTLFVRKFVAKIEPDLGLAVQWQDEALSSKRATEELDSKGVSYTKGDIDALAACYILSDYLQENQQW